MDNNNSEETTTITLTKRNGDTITILISKKDEILATHRWSALIGPKGQVYAHRTVDGQKQYLSAVIMARKLGLEALPKGQRCYHLNGNTRDKTRDNLDIHRPRKN